MCCVTYIAHVYITALISFMLPPIHGYVRVYICVLYLHNVYLDFQLKVDHLIRVSYLHM